MTEQKRFNVPSASPESNRDAQLCRLLPSLSVTGARCYEAGTDEHWGGFSPVPASMWQPVLEAEWMKSVPQRQQPQTYYSFTA